MALLDNFTGSAAALDTHMSDSGHSWTKHTTYSTGLTNIDGSGGAVHASANTDVYYSSWTPPSADHAGTFIAKTPATVPAETWGITFRTATASATFYRFSYSGTAFRLLKHVSSTSGVALTTYTTGASSITKTLDANTTYNFRYAIVGSQIKVWAQGGTQYPTETLIYDATDTSITAAGAVGLYFSGTPTTVIIDQITADAIGFTTLNFDVPEYSCFQAALTTGNAGNLAMGGKAPTGTASIEVKCRNGATVIKDWTAVTSFVFSVDSWTGLWLADFTAPAAWLQWDIRAKDSAGTVIGTALIGGTDAGARAHVGIGDTIAIFGSSSPTYAFNNARGVTYTGTPNPLASISKDGGITFALMQASDCLGGNMWAIEQITRTGRPAAYIASGSGGSTTLQWRSTDLGTPGSRYAPLKANHRRFCVFFACGKNDAVNSANGTSVIANQAAALQRYTDFVDDLRTFAANCGPAGGAVPVLISGTQGNADDVAEGDGSAPLLGTWMRIAELDLERVRTDVFYLTSQIDKVREGAGSTLNHMQASVAGEGLWGQQNGMLAAYALTGQTVPRLRLTDVQAVDATHTNLIFALGSLATSLVCTGTGTTGAASGGEVSSDNVTFVATSAVTVVAPNIIQLTHASLAGSNRFLRFMDTTDGGYGTNQPLTVRDNGTIPRTAEATKGAASLRPITIRATDAVSTTADLAVNLATLP